MSEEDLLTPADVAARCKVSVKTVLRAIHSGALRASRLGGRYAYRIRSSDVAAWLDDSTVNTAPPRIPAAVDAVSSQRTVRQSNRLVLTEEMGRRT
jgi:excisionase family DNA binding protein